MMCHQHRHGKTIIIDTNAPDLSKVKVRPNPFLIDETDIYKRKYKEGRPVPGVQILPKWWDNLKIGETLKGRAVRLNDNKSGDKYLRNIILKDGSTGYNGIVYGKVDVYAVLEAFRVVCPAAAHAVKKLLCPGIRGGKNAKQDIREAKDAVVRAFEMEEARIDLAEAMENAGDDPDPHDSFIPRV